MKFARKQRFLIALVCSLLLGFALCRPLVAIAFASSQKTLMVGLSIAISLQISILPIVGYHSLQLVIDTIFADRFRESADSSTEQLHTN